MKRICLEIFLIALLMIFCGKAEAGLVGYWDFNEGAEDLANDSSGNGNNATGLDSSWITGKYGYGTNSDHIVVPNSSSLQLTSKLSITAWARIDEFNGLQRRIAEKPYEYGLLFNPPNQDGQTAFFLELNDTNYPFEYQDIPEDQWFHTAVTWDGHTAQYYYNGNPATPVSAETTINPANASLFLGAPGYSLDEVRIYNDALTRDQVLHDGGFDPEAPPVVPEPSTFLLVGAGLVGTFWGRRKRKEK